MEYFNELCASIETAKAEAKLTNQNLTKNSIKN